MADYYNFDTPVDRSGTYSMKWDKYKGKDIIPLWVADMDFLSPPAVRDALIKRIGHGVFGYTLPPQELNEIIVSLMENEYGWKIEREWIVWLPGLVTGLNVVCRAVGEEGDDVMTAVPVYPPFLTAPGYSRRNLIKTDLVEPKQRAHSTPLAAGLASELKTDSIPYGRRFPDPCEGNLQIKGEWRFNFENIEKAITEKTRLFLLCNPHNPVGRVYDRNELSSLASICIKHNIVIGSDEIHCGLLLEPGKRHIPVASLSPEIADRTITLMAPSKTYNLPGLGCSFAIISNADLRKRFAAVMNGIVPRVNTLGYIAAIAAYRDSHEWHIALLDYLRENRDLVINSVNRMPGLSSRQIEATYLAWIDTRKSGIQDPARFFEDAGVGLSDGKEFGTPGFVRLNFGCRRSLLKKGLERMSIAVQKHAGGIF